MNLWKSMSGIVEVELTSADIAQSMEVLRTENITIFHLKTGLLAGHCS